MEVGRNSGSKAVKHLASGLVPSAQRLKEQLKYGGRAHILEAGLQLCLRTG